MSGLFSSLFGEGGEGDSNKALQAIQDVPLPILKEIHPEIYRQVVSLNPELEQAVTLGPSAMEGISTDPRLKQAQMNALNKLMEVGNEGGMTLEDRGRLATINNEVNANLKGNTDAIMQNLASRGMSGGMTELVARQNATQAAANRASQQGFDVAAEAQKRALNALMSGAELGGNMQSQEFSQKARVAEARDAIGRFNTENTQGVNNRNTDRTNNSRQWNAEVGQRIADANTNLNNETERYNGNGLAQQGFDNRMVKVGGIATGYNNLADRKDKNRDREAGFVGGLINAGASAYGGGKK